MHVAGRLHVARTPAPPLALVVLDVHAVLQVSSGQVSAGYESYAGSFYCLPSFPFRPYLLVPLHEHVRTYLQVALVHQGVAARQRQQLCRVAVCLDAQPALVLAPVVLGVQGAESAALAQPGGAAAASEANRGGSLPREFRAGQRRPVWRAVVPPHFNKRVWSDRLTTTVTADCRSKCSPCERRSSGK